MSDASGGGRQAEADPGRTGSVEPDADPGRTGSVQPSADRLRVIEFDAGVVRRPATSATPTIHAYLRHLRSRGCEAVPEPLAVSGAVESLRFVPGTSGADSWSEQSHLAGLASAARLLRRIHDAGAGWRPPDDAVWGAPPVPGDEVVFCHGDPGPWNMVWRDGEAVALIDWDFLHPGPRLDDIAYALRWFVPLRADDLVLKWHHFPTVPDRRERIGVFLEAYGDVAPFDLADSVIARMRSTMRLLRALADEGVEPQRTWVAEGALQREESEIAWIDTHRTLLG